MRCPRCQRESKESRFCPGCGAPLALAGDPPARLLDAPLDLDRRAGDLGEAPGEAPTDPDRTHDDLTTRLSPGSARTPAPSAPPARAPPQPPRPAPGAELGPLADLDRSSWDLGSVARGADSRTFAPVAPPPSGGGREEPGPARAEARPAPRERLAPPPLRAPLAARLPSEPFDSRPAAGPLRSGQAESRGAEASAHRRGAHADDGPHGLPDADVDALEIHLRFAPPWRRATAWAVDGLPFAALVVLGIRAGGDAAGLVGGAGAAFAAGIAALVAILLFVYQTLAHALAGATLGKRLLGLRVVGPDGLRPTFGRSAARAALGGVSVAVLGLGILLALFTDSGRSLHDLLARTWVVRAP